MGCHLFLQNYPLYIRSTPTESELKFHYMVHTSLDVVDEKISAMGKALVDQRELYLGLLYPTEDYKVYPPLLSTHPALTEQDLGGNAGKENVSGVSAGQAGRWPEANGSLWTLSPFNWKSPWKSKSEHPGGCKLT